MAQASSSIIRPVSFRLEELALVIRKEEQAAHRREQKLQNRCTTLQQSNNDLRSQLDLVTCERNKFRDEKAQIQKNLGNLETRFRELQESAQRREKDELKMRQGLGEDARVLRQEKRVLESELGECREALGKALLPDDGTKDPAGDALIREREEIIMEQNLKIENLKGRLAWSQGEQSRLEDDNAALKAKVTNILSLLGK
ncbi:hypothetical protein C8J56DRAFT_944413 [Mycena floridula]|nr:hypothetical protein C8J56DRAFT_944413 [Mycena floridula]